MEWTELFTPQQLTELNANHAMNLERRGTGKELDPMPVCRVYLPWMDFYWLLTEMDGDGVGFGLCVLFEPEIGYVDMREVLDVKSPTGERAKVDENWTADKTLSEYSDEVRRLFYG